MCSLLEEMVTLLFLKKERERDRDRECAKARGLEKRKGGGFSSIRDERAC